MSKVNIFTVDVEDWIFSSKEILNEKIWGNKDYVNISFERSRQSINQLLGLFNEYGVKATFFILGKFAERFPDIVKEIRLKGHEVGSHGYMHKLAYKMSLYEFEKDLADSIELLGKIIGENIKSYRAPYFSIIPGIEWVFGILRKHGIENDSSIYPFSRGFYGYLDWPQSIRCIATPYGKVMEFPITAKKIGKFSLPIGGGGYWRLIPLKILKKLINKCNHYPLTFYMHPYEIDPEELNLYKGLSWRIRLTQGIGRKGFKTKLKKIFSLYSFTSIEEYRKNVGENVC